jgi:outer membrane protein
MCKVIRSIFFVVVLSFSIVSFAQTSSYNNNYDEDYYENEGKLLFKVRMLGVKVNGTQKNLPTPTNASPTPVGKLITHGIGVDTGTTIFFNDYIASELSLSFTSFRNKNSVLVAATNNYNAPTPGKGKRIYSMPLAFTMQYHIAPFGAIKPYIGAGYHGAWALSKAKEIRLKNTHGAVLQAGVDLIAKDDTFINIDIKQYLSTTRITYKAAKTSTGNNVTSKLKLNPLAIGVGIGFMF